MLTQQEAGIKRISPFISFWKLQHGVGTEFIVMSPYNYNYTEEPPVNQPFDSQAVTTTQANRATCTTGCGVSLQGSLHIIILHPAVT